MHAAELRAIKNDDGNVTIKGYATVFDQLSEDLGGFKEKIDKNAFKSVLNSPDLNVVALFNHDSNIVFARSKSGTLKLSTDEKGLISEWNMPNTQAAKDTTELVKRGDISQMSFGFVVKSDDWEQRNGEYIRTITDVKKLFDVSLVTTPAYPQTSAGIRSLDNYISAEKPKEKSNESVKKAKLTLLKLNKK